MRQSSFLFGDDSDSIRGLVMKIAVFLVGLLAVTFAEEVANEPENNGSLKKLDIEETEEDDAASKLKRYSPYPARSTNGCCQVYHPPTCGGSVNTGCNPRSHYECSNICSSSNVHIMPQPQQPQVQSSCVNVQQWPYQYCGGYASVGCGGCYSCGGQYNPGCSTCPSSCVWPGSRQPLAPGPVPPPQLLSPGPVQPPSYLPYSGQGFGSYGINQVQTPIVPAPQLYLPPQPLHTSSGFGLGSYGIQQIPHQSIGTPQFTLGSLSGVPAGSIHTFGASVQPSITGLPQNSFISQGSHNPSGFLLPSSSLGGSVQPSFTLPQHTFIQQGSQIPSGSSLQPSNHGDSAFQRAVLDLLSGQKSGGSTQVDGNLHNIAKPISKRENENEQDTHTV